ncbi:MAG: hypothetical protein AB7O56_03125 [Bauldia sp.]
MSARSRIRGVQIWAAVAALYALVLHTPWMAGMPAAMPSVVAASAHAHGTPGEPSPRHSGPELCCVVCGAGPCAVGPVSEGSVTIAARRVRKRRIRGARIGAPHPVFRQAYDARGPPEAASIVRASRT